MCLFVESNLCFVLFCELLHVCCSFHRKPRPTLGLCFFVLHVLNFLNSFPDPFVYRLVCSHMLFMKSLIKLLLNIGSSFSDFLLQLSQVLSLELFKKPKLFEQIQSKSKLEIATYKNALRDSTMSVYYVRFGPACLFLVLSNALQEN